MIDKSSMSIQSCKRLLISLLVAHTIIWTAMCTALRSPVPYDAVDAANWGRHLEFGYSKGPYLVGWVSRLGFLFNGGHPGEFAYYFLHMSGIALGAYGVWLLALRLLQDVRLALLAVLALGLTTIVSVSAIPYNDNYLLIALWPYTFYFFIKACFDQRRYWIWAGLFAGLAMMAKYSTAVFLPCMLLYTLWDREVRQSYRSWEIYSGIAAFWVICLPNLFWLHAHDFAALGWVTSEIANRSARSSLYAYVGAFYPAPLLYLIITRIGRVSRNQTLSREQRAFVLVYLAPVVTLLAVFLVVSSHRLTEWLEPFAVFYSIALLIITRPELSAKAMRTFGKVVAAFVALFLAGYAVAYTVFDDTTNDKRYLISFSEEANEMWRQKTGLPLAYVGGEKGYEWLSFYAPDYPLSIKRWDPASYGTYNPTIDELKIRKHGALLIAPRACDGTVFESTFDAYPFMRSGEIVDHAFSYRGFTRHFCLDYYLPQDEQLPAEY
jgi:Dolichyl-phosphate-mannose-protein mannosyltransferase